MNHEEGPPTPPRLLTPKQIHTYLRDGILVVDNVLSSEEVIEAQHGLASTLKHDYGVNVHDLERTGQNLANASSTNGAGGVLDIFYPEWKLKIATNETLFRMTCQLWKEAYCHSGEQLEDVVLPPNGNDNDRDDRMKGSLDSKTAQFDSGHDEECTKVDGLVKDVSFKWHPFGAFDYSQGYMYIDRICYRIPTKLAEIIGKQISTTILPSHESTATKRRFKARPLQRSLTPHFDCCPEMYFDASKKSKWRPIQCFVSLTDNLQPNTGGFEACPGFHREFHSWVKNGRRRQQRQDNPQATDDRGSNLREGDDDDDAGGGDGTGSTPRKSRPTNKRRQSKRENQSRLQTPLCVGEYTHVSPLLDQDIIQRMVHIPVRAGSAVFWDNRIPHGNSYRNDSPPIGDDLGGIGGSCNGDGKGSKTLPLGTSGARAVVYCSFLPDVEVNRRFVARQLNDWKLKRPPGVGDRWIRQHNIIEEDETTAGDDDLNGMRKEAPNLSDLGKRLLGLVEWPRKAT